MMQFLIVKPGMIARGKAEIKKAFIAIAKYFITALYDARGNDYFRKRRHRISYLPDIPRIRVKDSEYSMERKATYVFKKNSQGVMALCN
jgi:ketosteroid isomerase-like protein